MDHVSELITCLRSWEPESRVLGNAQAGPAADALESMQADLHTYQVSMREANENRIGMIGLVETLQSRIKKLESEALKSTDAFNDGREHTCALLSQRVYTSDMVPMSCEDLMVLAASVETSNADE